MLLPPKPLSRGVQYALVLHNRNIHSLCNRLLFVVVNAVSLQMTNHKRFHQRLTELLVFQFLKERDGFLFRQFARTIQFYCEVEKGIGGAGVTVDYFSESEIQNL